MSANTKIEWAHHTFNPWEGCQKVGPGCDHCYAETRNARFAAGTAINWGPGAPRRRTSEANWKMPLRWNAEAERLGIRYRVFCASLADVFDNEVDPQWRADLFDLIAKTPNLDWLLLTKRIGNAKTMMADALHLQPEANRDGMIWPLPNVWIGATIVNQAEADRDIPKLLAVPAAKRFLSMEPLLGPVDLHLPTRVWADSRGYIQCDHCCNGDRCDDPTHFERGRPDYAPHCRCPHCRGTGKGKPIDWVIVGGESGHHARPMHPDWARSLREQCQAAGVPFLFKQWGEWNPGTVMEAFKAPAIRIEHNGSVHPWPPVFDPNSGDWCLYKVGKKAAGRQLDGRTWDGFPS